MKHSTFFWFFLPTGLAMLLFIALPLVSVVLQSVHTPHEAVLVTVENCGPFGCKKETTIDQDATSSLRAAEPLGRFVGLDIYFDRGHLAIAEVHEAWATSENWSAFFFQARKFTFLPRYCFYLNLYLYRNPFADCARPDDRAWRKCAK